ncbi:anti-sigma factor [Baekduia sp.]|uniref:anti-sigma factor n=1 Tax=Baekduia sp. TaxID=2600305 RepID=UPI0039C85990
MVVGLIDRGGGARTITGMATTSGARVAVPVDRDGHAVLRLAGMPNPPDGRVYEVWLVRRGDSRVRRTRCSPSGRTDVPK